MTVDWRFYHLIRAGVRDGRRSVLGCGPITWRIHISQQLNLIAAHGIQRGYAKSIACQAVVDAIRRPLAREYRWTVRRVIVLRPDELDGAKLHFLPERQLRGAGTAPDNVDTGSSDQPGAL